MSGGVCRAFWKCFSALRKMISIQWTWIMYACITTETFYAGKKFEGTDSEEQLTIYETQVDYYTKYIKSWSEWKFKGIWR